MFTNGIYLMLDQKHYQKNNKSSWFFYALLSAIFATLTSILSKIGLHDIDSNLATFICTIVILFVSWFIVFVKKEYKTLKMLSKCDLWYIIAPGITCGISWICYYYALQNGIFSIVFVIDKASIIVVFLCSYWFLKEKMSKKTIIGCLLLVIAIFLCH